jgi:hypothetical protein
VLIWHPPTPGVHGLLCTVAAAPVQTTRVYALLASAFWETHVPDGTDVDPVIPLEPQLVNPLQLSTGRDSSDTGS